jgi:uncharacterized protein (TIGR03435 family)
MEAKRDMRVGLAASLWFLGVCAAFGQSPEGPPAFDVASVKASAATEGMGRGERGMRPDQITTSPGGVTMMNVRFKSVVQWAYHLQAIQVTGPGWIDANRYDIVAKAAGPVTTDQLRAMTQTLLAQRFKLAFHKETKEMPAYVVTVAKGGHKMTQSQGEGEMQVLPDNNNNRMVAHFTHVTLSELAELASSPLQGVVVDQTGLKGAWDFTLDASSFAMTQPTGIDDAINMVIQAVNQQLGIKIEEKKVPAEVLIVDHAEKVPVEN